MVQQEKDIIRHERFINARKAVTLDMALHGPRFTLAILAFGVPVGAALSAFMFFGPAHTQLEVAEGCFFLWITLNYIPLLLHAISIMRQKSAYQEAAFELEHKDMYLLRYAQQKAAFLFIPFAMLALAVYQEWQKRSQR